MSPRRKASSGFTELPVVGLKHKAAQPEIRKVEQPENVKLVYWTRREKIELAVDKVKDKWNDTKDVLQKPANKFIISLLIKRLRIIMLNWLKERLKEPSTLQGAAGLAGAIGYALNPEMLELIATTVVSIISLIQIAKKEKLAQKKDEA